MSAFAIRCLEDYMEDVVDCFEDFIKKALMILVVAIGIILAILLYIVKALHGDQCSRRPSESRSNRLSCSLSEMGMVMSSGVPTPPVDFSRPVNLISTPVRSAAVQRSKKQEIDYGQERELCQDTYVDAKCSRTRMPIKILTPASSLTKLRYSPGIASCGRKAPIVKTASSCELQRPSSCKMKSPKRSFMDLIMPKRSCHAVKSPKQSCHALRSPKPSCCSMKPKYCNKKGCAFFK